MNCNPTVSIIIVTYNAEKFIEKTILSILNQSYKNYEIILIDGDSNDKTIDIINNYKQYFTVYISEKDNGIYDAMNKGVIRSSGYWVCFLNAGDTFTNNNILNNLFNNKKYHYDIIYGDVKVIYPDFNIILKAGNLQNIWKGMQFSHQSVFIRKDLQIKYLYQTKYKIVSDYDFFLNCFHLGYNFFYLNTIISNVITGGVSDNNRLITLINTAKISLKKDFKFIHFIYFLFIYLLNIFKTLLKYILPNQFINFFIKSKNGK
jgi:putative colanic acid biosynthesis glycosyltransferase